MYALGENHRVQWLDWIGQHLQGTGIRRAERILKPTLRKPQAKHRRAVRCIS